MSWDLFKLTPLHFIMNLISQGTVFSDDKTLTGDKGSLLDIDEKVLKSVRKYIEFFADLSI